MLQQHYSLFDSFFAPTRVIVVSEERLKQAEIEARQNQVDALDVRIEELSKYRNALYSELQALTPGRVGGDLDAMDDSLPNSRDGGTHDG